jgi:hypothetical protein
VWAIRPLRNLDQSIERGRNCAADTETMMGFEQLTQDEGSRLGSVRLRALQDAPDAFGTTFVKRVGIRQRRGLSSLCASQPLLLSRTSRCRNGTLRMATANHQN